MEAAGVWEAECWDELVVHDGIRSSQGSAVPERWVCEDVCNPGSRIPDEVAGTWRDGYVVHDDSRSSQGSVLPERWACGIDGNPGSRIPDEAAGQLRDELGVHDDSRCSLGSAVPERVCGIDGNQDSRIPDAEPDPFAAEREVLVRAVSESAPVFLERLAEPVAPGFVPLRR